jgi:XTP/dITP diphosphohydrolase
MSERALALATANPGKQRELRELLGDLGLALPGLDALPAAALPEEGDDYTANAAGKALAVARATGLPALADDSGLEVDALDGAPGPRSARYGGPGLDDAGRVERLLAALRDVPRERRGARFVCIAALAWPDGTWISARGTCEGRILAAPRGEGGFGYDPVFWVEEHAAAMAELPAALKNRISHRARALAVLRPALAEAHSRANTSSGVG